MYVQSAVLTLIFDLLTKNSIQENLSLTILHKLVCIKYESCTLKNTQVIMSKQKYCRCAVVTLTFDRLTKNAYASFSNHPASVVKYETCTSKTIQLSFLNQNVEKV